MIWGGQRGNLEKHSNKAHVQELAEKETECEAKARVTREDRRKQDIGVAVVEA